jgi:hypothetical protein
MESIQAEIQRTPQSCHDVACIRIADFGRMLMDIEGSNIFFMEFSGAASTSQDDAARPVEAE